MKLYIVRHGVSTGNTPGNLMGQGDHPLTEQGEAQARAVARRLAACRPMPVYCSDLARARATAEAIARVWPPAAAATADHGDVIAPPAVIADPRLRELHLGEYEGRCWDDFLADTSLGAAFDADPHTTALPGGESVALLEERVLAAVADILAATPEAAVLVAHDGPIRTILNHYLGVPAEKWWTLTTAHGGLTLLEWTDGWVNVRYVNDTCHLDGLACEPDEFRRSSE